MDNESLPKVIRKQVEEAKEIISPEKKGLTELPRDTFEHVTSKRISGLKLDKNALTELPTSIDRLKSLTYI